MEAYVKGIIIIGAVTSVLLMLLPHGSSGSGRYLKYIGSIATLLIIISPLVELFNFTVTIPSEMSTESTAGNELYSEVISQAASNISAYIKNRCAERFALEPESLKVGLVLDESNVEDVKIIEIQIFTAEQSSSKKERIRKYFAELFETSVYVFGP